MEVWRDVRGYEGMYQVSDSGSVRSLDRIDRIGRKICGVVLSPGTNGGRKGGYKHVNLAKDGQIKTVSVHRIVAETFLENDMQLQEVNHINENKADNRASNLEWCSRKQNIMHGTGVERCSASRKKMVARYEDGGGIVCEYTSVDEAASLTGISKNRIYAVCNGALRQSGDFLFGYLKRGDCE